MTTEREFDVLLRSWFDGSAPSAQPEGLLESVVAATAHTRPRPGWLVRLAGEPMPDQTRAGLNRFVPLALAASAVVVAVLIGIGLLARSPNVGPSPVPGPTHSTTPEPTAPPAPAMFAYIQRASGGRGTVWVANLDGTGAHELVPDPVGNQDAPVWSPDGTRLAFSWDPASYDGYLSWGTSFRLYLIDASGGEPQLVDTGCVAPCTGDSDAAFSRDGTHLVFVRSFEIPPTSSGINPATEKEWDSTWASVVATIDLSTGRVVELASTTIADCPLLPGQRLPGVPNCQGLQNHRPRWSPDGTQIVFTQDVPYDQNGSEITGIFYEPAHGPPPALFVVDADGRNLHQISPSAWSGDWSPDGARIVFGSMSYVNVPRADPGLGYDFRQYYDIYTIRPDGTDLRQLTSDQFSQVPSWTADGRIGFIRDPLVRVANGDTSSMGPRQFWVMDADGSNATQLSVSPQLQEAWPISWPPQP